MNQVNEDMKEILLGESLFFGLLGRVLYNQPDKIWLNSMIEEEVFGEVPYSGDQAETKLGMELFQNWIQNRNKGLDEEAFKDISADYTRLMVGVGKVLAPPWESVYFSEDRLVFQEQTLAVRNWYRRFGLELENLHKEPDDHIGLELSFIAYLAELQVKALEEQDVKKYELLNDAKRQFIEEHLLMWGFSWCLLVKENAKTDFYKGLGHMTMGALYALADQYKLPIPKGITR